MEPRGNKRIGRHPPGHRLAWVVALLLLLALPIAQSWAQNTTPRGAAHEDFGRMVFDWDATPNWSADIINNQLVLRFDKPVAGDPKALLKPLARYLKSVTISPDRRMLSFPLAVPLQLKSFVTGTSTVLDISEAKAPTASVATSQPSPLPPPPTPQPSGAPAKAEAATDLMVRGGEHPGFNRLVFDWPKPVDYSVNQDGNRVVIAFSRPARVNLASLSAALPSDVTIVETRPQGAGTAVVLALPPEMRVRHFTSGARIGLDLVRPAGAEPPPRSAGTPPPPLAPAPDTETQPQTLKPLAQSPPPTLMPPAIQAPPPAQAPAPAEAVDAPASVAVDFDQPSAAAVFNRAGWVWLVFERKATIDPAAMLRSSAGLVLHAEAVPTVKSGTAVRLLLKSGFAAMPRKEGKLWVFDLERRAPGPRVAFDVKKQFDFEDRGRVVIAATENIKDAVQVRDPEVGDIIDVVPVGTAGGGVRIGRDLPQGELLATTQGVALVPRGDGVWLDATHGSVQVAMPGGLTMSPDPVGAAALPPPLAEAPGPAAKAGPVVAAVPMPMVTGPLEIGRWLKGGADTFEKDHQKLLGDLVATRPQARGPMRIDFARHYLANGMAAEALGVLRDAAAADPALVDTPEFRGVRGAANFMMGRDAEAIEDLSHPTLKSDKQAGIWLAAARARSGGDFAAQAPVLRQLVDGFDGMPARLRLALGRVAVPALAAVNDGKSAARLVEAIKGPGLTPRDLSGIAYLGGLAAESAGQTETALAKYREAEAGNSRPDRAYAARNRIELQLKKGQITASEAIHQLERLRFAWRGEDFEYRLMKRLGELLLADKQYGEGLRALRSVAANFADNPDSPTISKMMTDAFNRLYLDGESNALPPITAIGLYDEFQELTPAGDKGDEMIRKLADRLASVDLLDRASDLLRTQVQSRLTGIERARVGARLAFLDLSNRKSDRALESLDTSEMPNLPPELFDQRRFLRVRALADLGRSAEALALIINDQSDDARKLRAEIYWGMQRWADAAAALESLIDPPGSAKKIDPALARRVLDLATALTLAKDERGLQRIGRSWGPLMAATDFKEAFALLTSESEHGIIDYRRVDEKIKQAENFQTFMGEWSKRVKSDGLSSMN